MASKYLAMQNKALRQGMYLAYVELPHSPVPYTTNGHIMVRGKVHEVKPLKSQEDKRGDVIALTDKRWLEDLKDMKPVDTEVMAIEDIYDTKCLEVEDSYYQQVYVHYVMARYPVAEWKLGGNKLVAVDVSNNIIAIIAPMKGKDNE